MFFGICFVFILRKFFDDKIRLRIDQTSGIRANTIRQVEKTRQNRRPTTIAVNEWGFINQESLLAIGKSATINKFIKKQSAIVA